MVVDPFDRGFVRSMRRNDRNVYAVQVERTLVGELHPGALPLAGVVGRDIFTDEDRTQLVVSASRLDSPDSLGRDGLSTGVLGANPGDEDRYNRQHKSGDSHNGKCSHKVVAPLS